MFYKIYGLIVVISTLALFATAVQAQDVECPTGYVCTRSDTDSTVTSSGSMTTTIKQPPPSAIAPQFSAGNNSDLCTIGASASVQTQILGISAGGTYTEENCKRLKNAKVLYDMGMKVAAVSTMCQDPLVFKAMMNAGTPCPYQGLIGDAAKLGWETHVEETEKELRLMGPIDAEKAAPAIGAGVLALLLLL
tara:strand:- start:4460 stop:5035 length:576 start_codon:yes stop_codon:yes gene_type:complete